MRILAAVTIAAAATLAPADPGSLPEYQSLVPPAGLRNMGWDVDMTEQWIAAGAPITDAVGEDAGAVAIYQLVEGAPVLFTTIYPPAEDDTSYFGQLLALDGDILAVGHFGAIPDGEFFPPVYIYHFDGTDWVFETKLQPETGTNRSYLGIHGLALDGARLLIGSTNSNLSTNDQGEPAGAAYLYRRTASGQWIEEATLLPPDLGDRTDFGYAVTLSGKHAAIGTSRYDTDDTTTGAVYVFRKEDGQWSFDQSLESPDPFLGDAFGQTLASSTNRIALTRFAPNPTCTYIAIEIYRRLATGWEHSATLTNPDATSAGSFGFSLDMDEHTLLAGTIYGGTPPTAHAFIRDGNTWSHAAYLPTPPATYSFEYGEWFYAQSVALHADRALIGSDAVTMTPDAIGTAYLFDLTTAPTTCASDRDADGVLTPDDIADFVADYLTADVSADIDRDTDIDPDDIQLFVSNWIWNVARCPCRD